MSVKTPVSDFLNDYVKENRVRCHTPGGKGQIYPHDITEINGAGSLYESAGIIAESERIAAGLFGAAKTLYSCSGSTMAIQAMLALVKTGSNIKKRIAAFRYAHRSFVSAAALLDFDIDWIYPDEFMSAKINPEAVRQIVNPGTAAVFVNSIDYYGGECDINATARACGHTGTAGVFKPPLLVDNAHGAYLAFTDKHPIMLGAAMTADSTHKTLPALTGAAYLHINDERFTGNAKAMTALFGTSSPSYLILESLDLCNSYIAEQKEKGRPEAFGFITELKKSLSEAGFPLRESDLLRITVDARACGYTGFGFADKLRKSGKNGVECEYADENYTVLLFSAITNKNDIEAVKAAFYKIPLKKPINKETYPILRPRRVTSVRESLFAPDKDCAFLPVKSSVGRICAGITAPCPPGVPLVMPGEEIGTEEAETLERFGVREMRVL